jgi:hypothetical protein
MPLTGITSRNMVLHVCLQRRPPKELRDCLICLVLSKVSSVRSIVKLRYQKPFQIWTVRNDNFGAPQNKAIRVDTQTPSFWTVCITQYRLSQTLAFPRIESRRGIEISTTRSESQVLLTTEEGWPTLLRSGVVPSLFTTSVSEVGMPN